MVARHSYRTRRLLTALVPTKPVLERSRRLLRLVGLGRSTPDGTAEIHRLSALVRLRDCHPLLDPPFVPADEAHHMRDGDVVIGLALDGEARAYPWWIMDNHHAANDVVGGQAVVVSLCEMCSSAVAMDPVVKDRRLTFATTHMYRGTTAMTDHQTESLWSPYMGSAIVGPLRGTRLTALPIQQMEWRTWRALYPHTVVLPGYLGSRTGHGSMHEMGTPFLPRPVRDTIANWDDRLALNTLVLGVKGPGVQRVYPLSLLRERGGVMNDELDGLPIVTLHHLAEGSYGALAFSRVMQGRTLTFAPGPTRAVDVETGSEWTSAGIAVSGPLAGRHLEFVDSHVSEWFIWAANYPGLEIADATPDPAAAGGIERGS